LRDPQVLIVVGEIALDIEIDDARTGIGRFGEFARSILAGKEDRKKGEDPGKKTRRRGAPQATGIQILGCWFPADQNVRTGLRLLTVRRQVTNSHLPPSPQKTNKNFGF